MTNMNGNKRKREIENNREAYSRRREQDSILILSEKLKDLTEKVDDKTKIDRLYQLIVDADNKKARKAIGRHLDGYKSEISSINAEAQKNIDNGNIKRPVTAEKTVYYVNRDGDNFHVGLTPLRSDDAYSEIFRVAFDNQKQRSNNYYKVEPIDGGGYIENEVKELDDVEEYWSTEQLKSYITKLERENPREAQKYKSSQIKKREAVSNLRKLYEEMSSSKVSLDKVERAITELENQKTNLPTSVYNKAQKSLLAQKKKEERKNQKLETKKDRIFQKTGLRGSINSANRYNRAKDELKNLSNQQMLSETLDKMNRDLKEAEQKLQEEYKKDEGIHEEKEVEVIGGDVYETGRTNLASRTNAPGIYKAQEEVNRIRKQIAEQENIIRLNNEKIEKLEKTIGNIAKEEVQSTIEGKKVDEKALPAGESTTRLTAHQKFAQNIQTYNNDVEIDHKAAISGLKEKNKDNKDLSADDRSEVGE